MYFDIEIWTALARPECQVPPCPRQDPRKKLQENKLENQNLVGKKYFKGKRKLSYYKLTLKIIKYTTLGYEKKNYDFCTNFFYLNYSNTFRIHKKIIFDTFEYIFSVFTIITKY